MVCVYTVWLCVSVCGAIMCDSNREYFLYISILVIYEHVTWQHAAASSSFFDLFFEPVAADVICAASASFQLL